MIFPLKPVQKISRHKPCARVAPANGGLLAALAAILLAGCAQQPKLDQAAAPAQVRLLALNDFHGYMEPNSLPIPDPNNPGKQIRVPAGGVAYIATRIAELRQQQPNSIVVGVGDLIGASPLLSGLVNDEPALQAMDMLGMRVSAIGNHEFDYGQEEFRRQQLGGCAPSGCLLDDPYPGIQFPYISANVLRETDGQPAWPATHIETIDGVRIGFIGATVRETPQVTLKERVAGLRFESEADQVNLSVKALRAQGIEALVVLLHEGATPGGAVDPATCSGLTGAAIEIANAIDPAVDVVMTAHTHKNYVCSLNGKLLTQGESYGRYLTSVDLTIDRSSGDVIGKRGMNHRIDPAQLRPQPEFVALIERARAKTDAVALRPVAKLGSTQVTKQLERSGESALGRLIADAQLAATRAPEKGGAQISLMNHGGVRQDLPSMPNASNSVNYGDCYAVHPFKNALIVMDLTGDEIKRLLEQQWAAVDEDLNLSQSQGFEYAFDTRRPKGDWIVPGSLKLNGQPLQPSASYRVVTNQFLADGGSNFSIFPTGRNRSTQLMDVEALIQYLTQFAPVTAPLTPRTIRVD
jgi:5'-nucleotidase